MDFTSLLFISTLLYTLGYVKSSKVSKQIPKGNSQSSIARVEGIL
jgi:hypothetical protein